MINFKRVSHSSQNLPRNALEKAVLRQVLRKLVNIVVR